VYLGTGINDATTGQSLAYTATGATPTYPASCSGNLGWEESYNDFSCSFTASSGHTYQATSQHGVANVVTDPGEGGGSTAYYDSDGYSTFAEDDLSSPFGEEYDPPYVEYTTRTQIMHLGQTSASDVAKAHAACGDQRDTLIAEYTKYVVVYQPFCTDFFAAATWPNTAGFTFAQLTPGQTTGSGQFAVLQSYMCTNLRAVFNTLAFSTQVNNAGGYRNPALEAAQKVYYNNSRHMAGDAADISTSGQGTTGYNTVRAAAKSVAGGKACVEPLKKQGTNAYTHLDWRLLGTGTFIGPSSCPPGW
jgi:hypothetical protein